MGHVHVVVHRLDIEAGAMLRYRLTRRLWLVCLLIALDFLAFELFDALLITSDLLLHYRFLLWLSL